MPPEVVKSAYARRRLGPERWGVRVLPVDADERSHARCGMTSIAGTSALWLFAALSAVGARADTLTIRPIDTDTRLPLKATAELLV
jgi:hypothetical protein